MFNKCRIRIAVNGDVVGSLKGKSDWWIIKMNNNGDTVWTRLMGSTENDFPNSIVATTDGGYVIAGQTGGLKTMLPSSI